jgi:hypothetical protein
MRHAHWFLAFFGLVGVACGGSPDSNAPASDDSTESDLKKGSALPPIALQYVGEYDWVPNTPGGDIQWLRIHRNGTYTLHWAMDEEGIDETGKVRVDVAGTQENGTAGPGYPIVFHLNDAHPGTPPDAKTATLPDCCSGTIHLTLPLEQTEFDLKASSSVGPDEDACDATHGSWTDDDADPTTGLYCLCPKHQVYIPSAGGCVE